MFERRGKRVRVYLNWEDGRNKKNPIAQKAIFSSGGKKLAPKLNVNFLLCFCPEIKCEFFLSLFAGKTTVIALATNWNRAKPPPARERAGLQQLGSRRERVFFSPPLPSPRFPSYLTRNPVIFPHLRRRRRAAKTHVLDRRGEFRAKH